jgi:hypothetical protein
MHSGLSLFQNGNCGVWDSFTLLIDVFRLMNAQFVSTWYWEGLTGNVGI